MAEEGASKPISLAPGASFEGYRLKSVLGRGGAGTVYEAIQLTSGRVVALKVLGLFVSEDGAAQFQREMLAAKAVSHPGLARVVEAGTHKGQPWLAVERLVGSSLSKEMARIGKLSPSKVSRIGSQAARALGAAHAQKLLHGDLKPASIFLVGNGDPSDQVKVLDLGIALGLEMLADGRFLATPQMMSPEHFSGEPLDQRSDIFSLGAVLYQAVTGRPPYGVTLDEVREGLQGDATPRYDGGEDPVGRRLAGPLRRALAKNRSERYQTMEEFAVALDEAIEPKRGAPASKTPPAKSAPWAATVGAADLEQLHFGSTEPNASPGAGDVQRPARFPILLLAAVAVAGFLIGIAAYIATR